MRGQLGMQAGYAEIIDADPFYCTSKVSVTNAQVEARVEDPAMRGESRSLDIIAINKGISYGGFFRLPTKGRYFITVKIQRPDAPPPGEARFEFDRY